MIDTTCLALLISIMCNFIQGIISVYRCYTDRQDRLEKRKSEKHLRELQSQNSGIWL